MAGSSVKDTDKGLADLVRRASSIKGSVTVGIHAPEGAEPDGDMTVAEVATINEFGGTNNHPPPRPFIRGWADAKEAENRAAVLAMAQQILANRVSAQQGLERLGLKFVAGIQAYMVAGVPPPNAQSTIDRKGSSTPLINTGQMKSAVRHKVEGTE